MFGAMWSEHCGYKNSRPLLARFPTEAPRVLQGPGENAGAVDIGDGLARRLQDRIAQPPQRRRAVRGRGDRRRRHRARHLHDGRAADRAARLAALRPARRSAQPLPLRRRRRRHRRLRQLPRHPDRRRRGLLRRLASTATRSSTRCASASSRHDGIVRAKASGRRQPDHARRRRHRPRRHPRRHLRLGRRPGGVAPGRRSRSATRSSRSCCSRPASSCCERRRRRRDAGSRRRRADQLRGRVRQPRRRRRRDRRRTRAAPRSGHDRLRGHAQREPGAHAGRRQAARASSASTRIVDRWSLHCQRRSARSPTTASFGSRDGETVVGRGAGRLFTDACPTYVRRAAESPRRSARPRDATSRRSRTSRCPTVARQRCSSCSRRRTSAAEARSFDQYDHTILTNTVVRPGRRRGRAAHQGHRTGIATATDCNSRYCYLDPLRSAARIAVAEAAATSSCTGATPAGDHQLPQLRQSGEAGRLLPARARRFAGIADACAALGVPVVSGNVSLYNETGDSRRSIPTPTVGAVGVLDDVTRHATMAWQAGADRSPARRLTTPASAGASILAIGTRLTAGDPPPLDLDRGARVQRLVRRLIADGSDPDRARLSPTADWRSRSPKMAIVSGVGADVRAAIGATADASTSNWFGEAASRDRRRLPMQTAIATRAPSAAISVTRIGPPVTRRPDRRQRRSRLRLSHMVSVSCETALSVVSGTRHDACPISDVD